MYIKAIVQPRRTDDLKPKIMNIIGKEFIFEYAWKIEEGQFKGQIAFMNISLEKIDKVYGWLPSEDLIITKFITHEELQVILKEEK